MLGRMCRNGSCTTPEALSCSPMKKIVCSHVIDPLTRQSYFWESTYGNKVETRKDVF